ncbi:tyrosinase family protein [Kitasatospora sp. NBC_01560]|uniref:tyrosinase family protein n=1 Tax=Kitasatospora sp. NBC_01560 TaxID=2975965 RepID=UPI00386DEC5B
MDIRKDATRLTPQERDRFLEALIRLKQRQAPGAPAGVGVYDRFVALHGAVMAVIAPGLPAGETVNYGHWNIGFCAWHRKYLREFELALQAEVPGVTVPYWNWADHVGATGTLFTDDFLGSLRTGAPAPLTGSVLRRQVPPAERPAWWPAGAGGFPVHPLLVEGFGTSLARGSVGVSWPPTRSSVDQLAQLLVQQPGVHPFWYFWLVLEQGAQPVLTDLGVQATTRTHNRGHNFIGGHMSQAFSPNDPVFWLHHANVDRIWAAWQAGRLAAVPGSVPADHYPPAAEESPFSGDPAPPGHRLGDVMWPWVGDAPGYDVRIAPEVKALLPDFSGQGPVTVDAMLDTRTVDAVGYRYEAPGGP